MSTYLLKELPIDSIKASDRARPVDQNLIVELAKSIETSGLLHPIVVRPISSGEQPAKYQIVAGHHRFRAVAEVLKRTTILCAIRTLADMEAELAEIDENLLRAPLTPAQEARAHSRRKVLYLAIYPETRAGVAGASARHGDATDTLSYAGEAAKRLGTTARTIQRHVARGDRISDEIATKITGTSLDKGVELDTLAALPADQQTSLADRAAAGENVSARTHRESVEIEVATVQVGISAAEFGEQVFRRCTSLVEPALEIFPPERAGRLLNQTLPAIIINNIVEQVAQLLCETLFEYA